MSPNKTEISGDLGEEDKAKPLSNYGEMDHPETAVSQLIAACCDIPINLEMTENLFDTVALFVERRLVIDFHAAVRSAAYVGLNFPVGEVSRYRLSVIAFVRQESIWQVVGQVIENLVRLASCCFSVGQMKGVWSP